MRLPTKAALNFDKRKAYFTGKLRVGYATQKRECARLLLSRYRELTALCEPLGALHCALLRLTEDQSRLALGIA